MLLAGTARVACGVSGLAGLAGWLVSSSQLLEVLRRRPRFREAKPRGPFNSISRFLLIDFDRLPRLSALLRSDKDFWH